MDKQHYHLVAGEVLFVNKDGNSGCVRLNTMLTSTDGNVPVRLIGKAQQALQMRFFEQLEDPDLQVVDVFLHGISHLGLMTAEEFSAPPEGYQEQEIKAPALVS